MGVRAWSVYAMGGLWTMRLIHFKGFRSSLRGPYRVFRYPDYGARLLEHMVLLLWFELGAGYWGVFWGQVVLTGAMIYKGNRLRALGEVSGGEAVRKA